MPRIWDKICFLRDLNEYVRGKINKYQSRTENGWSAELIRLTKVAGERDRTPGWGWQVKRARVLPSFVCLLTNILKLCCNTLCRSVLSLKTGDMECITTKLSYYITRRCRGGGGLHWGPIRHLQDPTSYLPSLCQWYRMLPNPRSKQIVLTERSYASVSKWIAI